MVSLFLHAVSHLLSKLSSRQFEKWENQVRHFLEKKKNSIVNLQVMKDPDNKTIDIWDNLDIQLLYNNIRNEKSNLRKS